MKHHILYLFLNIPLIVFVKIGVTGKGKATTSAVQSRSAGRLRGWLFRLG